MPQKGKPTDRDLAFVKEYLSNGRIANTAYEKAIGKGKNTKLSANNLAQKMLKRPGVKALIMQAESKELAKVEEVMGRYAITRERVMDELAKIAFADLRDTVEWDGEGNVTIKASSEITDAAAAAIAEIDNQKGPMGSKTKLKNYDKLKALMDLAKIAGIIEDKPTNNMAVQFIIQKD